jgi:3-oxoacyl-[acyl-carrier protein] reductase
VVLADLSDPAEHDRLVEASWTWRPIDVWVNNAGADVLTGDAANWSFEEKLSLLWRVDVLGTLRLSRTVGQRMKQRAGGVILNMGWDQAATGMAGDSGQMFAAVKGAVMAATRSLAKSLAPEVRVNCLAPGWIRTAWGQQASADWQDRARDESLLGRWGEPLDVARVACFLASPAAQFVNGQIININGGRFE